MPPDEPSIRYNPAFDGLRGLAIILVIAFHADVPGFKGGFIGVNLFFTLSGFLITQVLLREHHLTRTWNFKNFYRRRAVRLLPALLVFLTTYVAIELHLNTLEQTKVWNIGFILIYCLNWVSALNPGWHGEALGHCWSLSVEEQFYLLWPIALAAAHRLGGRTRCIVVASAGAFGSAVLRTYLSLQDVAIERLYYGFDTRVDSILMGCALGAFLSTPASRLSGIRNFGRTTIALSAWIIVFWVGLSASMFEQDTYLYKFSIVTLASAIAIADLAVSGGFLRRAFEFRPLVWLGKISYGLYLWHYFVLHLTRLALGVKSGESFKILTIALPITLACATASYYAIELPFMRHGRQKQLN